MLPEWVEKNKHEVYTRNTGRPYSNKVVNTRTARQWIVAAAPLWTGVVVGSVTVVMLASVVLNIWRNKEVFSK